MPSETQVNRNGKRHPQDGLVPVNDTRHTDLAREEAMSVRKLQREADKRVEGSSSGSDSGAGISGDERDDDDDVTSPGNGCTSEDSAVSSRAQRWAKDILVVLEGYLSCC